MENRSEIRLRDLTDIALRAYLVIRENDKIPTPMVVRDFAKKVAMAKGCMLPNDDEYDMLHEAISWNFQSNDVWEIYLYLREIYFGEPKSFELRERVQADDVEQQDRIDRARDMNAERY